MSNISQFQNNFQDLKSNNSEIQLIKISFLTRFKLFTAHKIDPDSVLLYRAFENCKCMNIDGSICTTLILLLVFYLAFFIKINNLASFPGILINSYYI